MIFYRTGVDYKVDVLYGYNIVVDRGITFSTSKDGHVGYIDRAINSLEVSFTIQTDTWERMAKIREIVQEDPRIQVKLEDGEHLFGVDKSPFIADGVTRNVITVAMLTVGEITRKNLKQYTMNLSISPQTYIWPDTTYSYVDPEWDTLRYNQGYTTGHQPELSVNGLLNGSTKVNRQGLGTDVTSFTAELTNEEMALWHRSLIQGGNRIENYVADIDMYLALFGYLGNSVSDFWFFVRSVTFQNISFDKWNVGFEIILNKKRTLG